MLTKINELYNTKKYSDCLALYLKPIKHLTIIFNDPKTKKKQKEQIAKSLATLHRWIVLHYIGNNQAQAAECRAHFVIVDTLIKEYDIKDVQLPVLPSAADPTAPAKESKRHASTQAATPKTQGAGTTNDAKAAPDLQLPTSAQNDMTQHVMAGPVRKGFKPPIAPEAFSSPEVCWSLADNNILCGPPDLDMLEMADFLYLQAKKVLFKENYQNWVRGLSLICQISMVKNKIDFIAFYGKRCIELMENDPAFPDKVKNDDDWRHLLTVYSLLPLTAERDEKAQKKIECQIDTLKIKLKLKSPDKQDETDIIAMSVAFGAGMSEYAEARQITAEYHLQQGRHQAAIDCCNTAIKYLDFILNYFQQHQQYAKPNIIVYGVKILKSIVVQHEVAMLAYQTLGNHEQAASRAEKRDELKKGIATYEKALRDKLQTANVALSLKPEKNGLKAQPSGFIDQKDQCPDSAAQQVPSPKPKAGKKGDKPLFDPEADNARKEEEIKETVKKIMEIKDFDIIQGEQTTAAERRLQEIEKALTALKETKDPTAKPKRSNTMLEPLLREFSRLQETARNLKRDKAEIKKVPLPKKFGKNNGNGLQIFIDTTEKFKADADKLLADIVKTQNSLYQSYQNALRTEIAELQANCQQYSVNYQKYLHEINTYIFELES